MTNPQAVEALRGNPADIYSRPWTRHGSGEDEWWSINGYTAKRDWRRTWVVRYRGVAVAEDNDLQQAMATALLNNSADGNAQPAPQPEAQPTEWTPEMSRAVQLYSELGAYAASNLSGAYGLFEEFWSVAHRAAVSSPAPELVPLSPEQTEDAAEEWFERGDCPGREASRKKAAKLSFKAGVKFAEEIRFIGLGGGM